ncbi:MAG: SNF2-related protein, partial [Pseudonocardiaceae bacterium]
QRVLIAAPTAALGVWPRELRIHSRREWHVESGTYRTRTGKLRRVSLDERFELQSQMMRTCSCGRPHAMVVSYEAMARDPLRSASLAALNIDGVVDDEGHRLKKAGGVASRTALSWLDQVGFAWALSGTPMPQSPDDIYGLYRSLDPSIFGMNHTYFRAEFIHMVKNKEGQEFPRDVFPHARFEFSRRFHSIAYIPRVDLKLPPITHSIIGVELEPAARTAYEKLRDTGLAEISAAVAASGGALTPDGDERTVTPKNSGVALLRLMQFTGGSVSDDDGHAAVVSRAKANALAEFAGGKLAGGPLYDAGCRPDFPAQERNPVTVFCRFTHDLAAVRGVAEKAGLRYREISGKRKDGLTEDATMVDDVDVLGVQIQAGGIGIDLTRGHTVVWYSVGLELWLYQQAMARTHRKGQTRAVQNYYLIAENTIDGLIYRALARKEQIIDSVVRAYLEGSGELDSAHLDAMPTEAPSAGAAPASLPPWMGQDAPPRRGPDTDRDAEAALLAEAGLAGL